MSEDEVARLERLTKRREIAVAIGAVLIMLALAGAAVVLAWLNVDADREYVRWLMK